MPTTNTPPRPAHRRRILAAALSAAALGFTGAGPLAAPASGAALQQVMFVGNNWDGTADVIKPSGDFAKIGRINVIPDKDQRLLDIYLDPIKLVYFLGIRSGPGEGHDQFI